MSATEWIVGENVGGVKGIVIRVISGEPRVGEEVTCVETGNRYRVISAGALLGPDAYAHGYRYVHLDWIGGVPTRLIPAQGTRLVREEGDGNAPGRAPSSRSDADALLADEITRCPDNVRSKIIIATSEDINAERLQSCILFAYSRQSTSWLSSVRVLFRTLAQIDVQIPVFIIAHHMIPPLFVRDNLSHAVPRGKGEAFWFHRGSVRGNLAQCTDNDMETIRELTQAIGVPS